MDMTPGKSEILIIPTEVHTHSGPTDGTVRVQRDGIFIGSSKTMEEVGLTWEDLLRIVEHPTIAEELDAHAASFSSSKKSSP